MMTATNTVTANMVLTDEICECPICFDEVAIGEKNSITTACNHTFHASCLIKNINRNGFTCPCCRSLMAEDLKNDSDEDSDYGSDDGSTEEMDLDEIALEDEVYQSAYLLRGLRYFFERVEGNQDEEEEEEEKKKKKMMIHLVHLIHLLLIPKLLLNHQWILLLFQMLFVIKVLHMNNW